RFSVFALDSGKDRRPASRVPVTQPLLLTAMAHLRPRYKDVKGKRKLVTHHAEFYDPLRRPKRKYVPLRTRSKEAARGKLAVLEARYGRGEWDPWTDTVPREGATLGEAAAAYLRAKPDLRPASVRSFKSLKGLLAKRLGEDFPLEAVEPRHLALVIRRDLAERTRLRGCSGFDL